jgi:hypothetical protein
LDDATLTKLICFTLGEMPGWDWHDSDEDADGDELHVYAPDAVVVFYGALGTEPDTAVGVRVYGTTDERDLSWRRVQLRIRGARGRPDELSRLGGISTISRQSMAPAGADGNRREERTENYLIILDNQESLI